MTEAEIHLRERFADLIGPDAELLEPWIKEAISDWIMWCAPTQV
jgi:hypothetical protein